MLLNLFCISQTFISQFKRQHSLICLCVCLSTWVGCKDARRLALEPETAGAQSEGGVSGLGGEETGGEASGGETGGTEATGGVTSVLAPRLKLKNSDQLSQDLSQVLSIPKDEICNELGLYSCLNMVHTVTLGGVDPYYQNIYRPVKQSTATAPMALERVIFHVCNVRIVEDLTSPNSAVIFKDLPIENARFTDLDAPQINQSVQELFHRALLRDATTEELTSLKALYTDIENNANVQQPAPEWMWMTCFGVLSSVEFLFY